MARSKGIDRHPIYKLGKAPARRDRRNLRFAAILRAPVKLPAEYDFDLKHPGIPVPMFANDRYGDCVLAGRAHQTLRFELLEQQARLRITDDEVIAEYLAETGGADSGLVVLDSLSRWRHDGWIAARRRYRIQAYTELDRARRREVKQAIVLDVGVGLGLALPISAQAQFQSGKAWDVVAGSSGAVNSWGGHYVLAPGYTKRGPVCVTWGQKHQMTWAFFEKYCDEAYAIIDAKNDAKQRRALDLAAMKRFLRELD
jgi:hypothetical protein